MLYSILSPKNKEIKVEKRNLPPNPNWRAKYLKFHRSRQVLIWTR